MNEKDTKTMLRATGAVLAFEDKTTQHWTVPVEVHDSERFQRVRDSIPFGNLYCHGGSGGFVVYLDKPRCNDGWPDAARDVCRMLVKYSEKTGWGDLSLAGTGDKETDDVAIKIMEKARGIFANE